jgi:hypothetical protein
MKIGIPTIGIVVMSTASMAAPVAAQSSDSQASTQRPQDATSSNAQHKLAKHTSRPPASGHVAKVAVKLTCFDYAWQSEEMKDCLAGKISPPNWR